MWRGRAGDSTVTFTAVSEPAGSPALMIRAVGKEAATGLVWYITGLRPASERAEHLASDADIILSVVTADDALAAAQLCPYLSEQHIFIDANSILSYQETNCSTGEATGASYLDMAIGASIFRGDTKPLYWWLVQAERDLHPFWMSLNLIMTGAERRLGKPAWSRCCDQS